MAACGYRENKQMKPMTYRKEGFREEKNVANKNIINITLIHLSLIFNPTDFSLISCNEFL